ncbi:MAG: hypothetical protein KGN77_12110 [Xanthomonadaceae bacterium]|nr:hypothetical protein [Xanthomonadaceae bacterium]MDE1962773.1 hypothetical protein [Xanthomonadaceae bacterium]
MLRTLPAVAGAGGRGAGIEVASSASHGHCATPWRLLLEQLEAGEHRAHDPATQAQLAPLDAALILEHAAGRPLLRLQVTAISAGQSLHLTESTRIVRLECEQPDDAELITRPLQGPMLLPTAGQGWLAWLLAGHAGVRLGDAGWALACGVPTWLPAEDGQRLRVEGGGELLLVRFRTLPVR